MELGLLKVQKLEDQTMAAHVSETAKHRSQRLGDSGPLFVWKTLSFSLVSEATTKQSIHQMFFHPNGSQWLFNSVFFAKKIGVLRF